jgi:hypothetical protein
LTRRDGDRSKESKEHMPTYGTPAEGNDDLTKCTVRIRTKAPH